MALALKSFAVEFQALRSSLVFVRQLNRFPFPFPFEENKEEHAFSQREHALENIYFWKKEREKLDKIHKEGGVPMPPIVTVPGPDSLSGVEEAKVLVA